MNERNISKRGEPRPGQQQPYSQGSREGSMGARSDHEERGTQRWAEDWDEDGYERAQQRHAGGYGTGGQERAGAGTQGAYGAERGYGGQGRGEQRGSPYEGGRTSQRWDEDDYGGARQAGGYPQYGRDRGRTDPYRNQGYGQQGYRQGHAAGEDTRGQAYGGTRYPGEPGRRMGREWSRGFGEGYGLSSQEQEHRRGEGAGMSGQYGGGYRGAGPRSYVRSDERVLEDVNERLTEDDLLDAREITVRCANGVVTLEGTVAERWMKHRAEDLADASSGVKQVDNRIQVQSGWNPDQHATEARQGATATGTGASSTSSTSARPGDASSPQH